MEKQVIKLDREEIKKAIEAGDNAYGQRWMAVSPSGTYRLHWADDKRQWNPWNDDDRVIGLPALFAEGEGDEYEMAQDAIKANGEDPDEVEDRINESREFDGLVSYAEARYGDWMEAARENYLDFYTDAFLAACNGDGSELNYLAPWGYKDADSQEEIEPPFTFEWK